MKKSTILLAGLLALLSGCKGKIPFLGSNDTLEPVSTHSLKGVDDFDINTYQVGDEQLTDQIYYFGFDKSDLSEEYQESLTNIAKILAENNKLRVRVEGHTDDLGSSEYNIALGWRRAGSVSSYLESHGVARDRVETVSFGKENPLILGTDEEARAKNRRAFVSFSGAN